MNKKNPCIFELFFYGWMESLIHINELLCTKKKTRLQIFWLLWVSVTLLRPSLYVPNLCISISSLALKIKGSWFCQQFLIILFMLIRLVVAKIYFTIGVRSIHIWIWVRTHLQYRFMCIGILPANIS